MSEFTSWRSYYKFATLVTKEYRYIQTAEAKHFLDTLLQTSIDKHMCLDEGTILYRSQRGYDEVERYGEDGITPITMDSLPYLPDRMIPNAERSQNGRANPSGIPYLYLSNDLETAIAESRPWIKEKISVAEFKVVRSLNIIDFSMIERSSHFYFKEPKDAKVREKEVWASVNSAFSEPVSIEDQNIDYIPTQIISELFRSEGFDGIKYKSMLTSGSNYALFNFRDAIPTNGAVFEITGIMHQFAQYGNTVYYPPDGTNNRIYNIIDKFMPLKDKEA